MNFLRRFLPWRLSKHQTLTLITILGYVLTRKPSELSTDRAIRTAICMDATLKTLYNTLIKNDPKFAHLPQATLTDEEKRVIHES